MDEDRRNVWTFVQGEKGFWSWRVLTPEYDARTSEGAFRTLNECVADAASHGYALPSPEQERRAEPRRPPAVMVMQNVTCLICKRSWHLQRHQFVSKGEIVRCPHGCGDFRASASSVTCCIEDGTGVTEIPLG
jgi:hypothetical protein